MNNKYRDVKSTNKKTDTKKIALATGIMILLLVGTIGTFIAVEQYEILNQKYLNLKEQIGAGDGERGDIGAWMTFTIIKEDGSRIVAWEGHNAMTALGLDYICSQVSGLQAADQDYLAIGTGTGGTTTLNAEIFRAQGTYTKGTTGVFTIDYTWSAGTFSGEVVTEAGTLNAASTGVLFNYQTFAGITLTTTDSLAVEFEFTFS